MENIGRKVQMTRFWIDLHIAEILISVFGKVE